MSEQISELPITADVINNLAAKLDALEPPELSQEERAVLLAIFALAADAIGLGSDHAEICRRKPQITVTLDRPIPAVEDMFKDTFQPTLFTGPGPTEAAAGLHVTLKIGR